MVAAVADKRPKGEPQAAAASRTASDAEEHANSAATTIAEPTPAPEGAAFSEPADDTDSPGIPMSGAMKQHLVSHLNEAALHASMAEDKHEVVCMPLRITLQNLRANSKALVIIRDDQRAVWSEGDGSGLVGLSFSTSRDPALYVRNFLINAREFYVQTYNTCQEILVNLYVRTSQPGLRGRVDLPPGAIITLQSTTERVSLVGLSAFAIDF